MGRRYIDIWCHYLLTNRILSKPVRFVPHVLGKPAPGFRWKEMHICSKILPRSVAEKAVINEPVPYSRSQCKFVTLQMLRMCSLQIKSQIPHYFTKYVLRHGIREKTKSPISIPQHIIVIWPAVINPPCVYKCYKCIQFFNGK